METVILKRAKETSGLYKGFNKTEAYKDGKLFATFPANLTQPRKGGKTIVINCFRYKSIWPIEVKTIDIQAKEWFDKVNGNSYFAGKVTVNYGLKNEQSFTMPFQYGYGSQYEQEARKILSEQGLITPNSYAQDLRDKGIVIRQSIQRNCLKRELMSY